MEGKGINNNSFFEKSKPYIAMICLQFGYAGMNIVTKVSLNGGMSHYVLVVYRHAFATAVMAPFALIFERPVIDQNFYYMGLKYTSPTFSCAMSNMLPAMTFVMALICRMEKVDIKKLRCIAKVVGTLITVGGAMLMTLYKGHVINMVWSSHANPSGHPSSAALAAADKDWAKGSILLILATLAWAAFFILQAITMRKYTAHLSLTTLVCFLGTLQSIVVTFVMEHKPSVWTIGWDMNLLAAAYAGIISSAIAYYVQGIVMEKRGPVFVTAFSPLMMIIVAFMGSFILAEKIYVGGVLGAVLIVMGLYSVLWGKYKEFKEKEVEEMIPEVIKGSNNNINNNQMTIIVEELGLNDVVVQEIAVGNKPTTVAISAPIPQPPMLAMEAPKRPQA
ncbi:hypothetical protein KSS87_000278 [Heliosperma pusillum]|nr:hypothetical protein KSS87_000278 [Heliosperma pusillum]